MRKKFFKALLLGLVILTPATTFVSCKDYDDDIATLNSQNTSTAAAVATLQSDVTSLQSALSAAKTELANAIATKADASDLVTLQTKVSTLETQIAAAQAALDSKADKSELERIHAALTGDIKDLQDYDKVLKAAIDNANLQVEANKNAIAALQKLVGDVDVPGLKTKVDEAVVAINQLTSDVTKLQGDIKNCATKDELSQLMTEVNGKIAAMESKVGQISVLNVCVSRRLTSVVFAPTTYIGGIEAITFATLKYEEWSDLCQDVAQTGRNYTIDGKNTIAEYYVNPLGVKLDDIDELSFIGKGAVSRAAEEGPIKVVDQKLEGSLLKLTVAKTDPTVVYTNADQCDATTTGDDITIVALKAKLGKNVLVEGETEVNVYSDWARLAETNTTPFIHNTRAYDAVANKIIENNVADEATDSYVTIGGIKSSEVVSHFYAFSEIYKGVGSPRLAVEYKSSDYVQSGADATIDDYVTIQLPYDKKYDLAQLVEVCDKNFVLYDEKEYNLSFEFKVMPYIFKNEGTTLDATDQANFAILENGTDATYKNSIIVATARDHQTTLNRDAVNRTPVIQVVLKDNNNNGKVIDCRYFKIKWVADEIPTDPKVFDVFDKGAVDYVCGNAVEVILNEEDLNTIYTKVTEGGLSRVEFHNTYSAADGVIYASLEAAKAASTAANDVIGTWVELNDNVGGTQAYNDVLTFDAVKLTNWEDKTITGWIAYQAGGKRLLFIPVTVTVKAPAIALDLGPNTTDTKYMYRPNYWKGGDLVTTNADKYIVVNPQLSNDKGAYTTTVYNYSIIDSYEDATGAAPTSVGDLVYLTQAKSGNKFNADYTKYIFDGARLNILPTLNAGDKWELNDDKTILYYIPAGGVKQEAAIIVGKQIFLYDGQLSAALGGAWDLTTQGSRLLIGAKAPVVLQGAYCEMTKDLDHFLVFFEVPLKAEGSSNIIFYDQTGHSTYQEKAVALTDLITVKEAFSTSPRIVYGKNAVAGLQAWYGVQDVVVDLANATLDGKKLSDYKDSEGNKQYELEYTGGKMIWRNHNTNALVKDLVIKAPAYVQTKWQDAADQKLYSDITVTIKQESTGAKKN